MCFCVHASVYICHKKGLVKMCCDLLIRMVFHFIFGHWNTKRKVQCHFHQISTNVFSGVHSAVESFMANKFNSPVLALMLWPTEQDYTSECLRLSTSVAHQSFKIWMSSSRFCAKIICDSSNCVAFLKDIDTNPLAYTNLPNEYLWMKVISVQTMRALSWNALFAHRNKNGQGL